jgi:hypothetical protein
MCRPPAPGILGCVVDHCQDAEAPAVGQLVSDEVQAPALVGCQCRLDRPSRSDRPFASTAPAYRQSLLAVEALDPLLVDGMIFAPQQHVQTTVAKPPSLLGQGFQPFTQRPIVRSRGPIAHACPVGPNDPAGPSLAHLEALTQIRRRLPSRRGRHHFFPEGPSGRRCPAWRPPASASAGRSHPPAPSAASPQTLPARRTWPSTFKTSPSWPRTCGTPPPWEPWPPLPQHRDDLLFRKP